MVRGLAALLATLLLGGFLTLRALHRSPEVDTVAAPTAAAPETVGWREASVPLPPPRLLELTDVYTSEAARLAAEWSPPRQNRTVPSPPTLERPEPEALTEATPLAGLLEPEESPLSTAESPATPLTPETGPLGAEVLAATATVEAFLQEAVEAGDVEGYASLLDPEFLYAYNNGTPATPEDDRILPRDDYLRWIVPILFPPDTQATVNLSPPRDLEWMGPDLLAVRYDYDMRLQSDQGARRFAGTADFLLRRDPEDAWRILEWNDAPPDRKNWQLGGSQP